jgi:predicted permease
MRHPLEWLLRLAVPKDDRSAVLGDLSEEYERRVRPQRSWLGAHAWYVGELCAAVGFGLLGRVRQLSRAVATFRIEAVGQDVRYGVRSLRKSPGFTAVAVLSLALGLGANLAVFRFVEAVLLDGLPVPHPDELAIFRGRGFGYPWFRELAAEDNGFANVAARFIIPVNLTTRDHAEFLPAEIVSGSYFETLGVRPAAGRLLNAGDDGTEGAHPVCVISDRLWQEQFGGDPSTIGRTVLLNTHPFQIVGVTERGFAGAELHARFDLQVPMSMIALLRGNPRDSWDWTGIQVFGRLKPGVSRAAAEQRVRMIGQQIDRNHAKVRAAGRTYSLDDGRQGLGTIRPQLGDPVLVAALLSGLVLLLACANLANLLLAKTSDRRHEFAVRRSLGASRTRLVSLLLIEVLLLAVGGGVLALGVATVLDRVLGTMLFGPNSLLHVASSPSRAGLTAAAALVIGAALAIGLLPALAATREAPLEGLRDTPRTGARRPWSSRALVVIQMAVCLTLVFGAGLFARSLLLLRGVDLGLNPGHVIVMRMDPELSGDSAPASAAFYDAVLQRARLVLGVESAGLASEGAMTGTMFNGPVRVPGSSADPDLFNNDFNAISPGYLATVGLPLVAGRAFTDRDAAGVPGVVIVNQRFVDYYWPGRSPIGRHIAVMGQDEEIVGLVKTAKYLEVREDPQITIYFPVAQHPASERMLYVRTAADPTETMTGLETGIRAIDPHVPIYGAASLGDYVNEGLSSDRVLNLLAALYGAIAVIVSAAGLYGLVSHSVGRRTREIGVRLAVGAQRSDVLRLFVVEMATLVLLGIAVGAPLALAVARQFAAILYGLAPSDPLTLAAAAFGLGTTAVVAVALAAGRATRIDPVVALRTA